MSENKNLTSTQLLSELPQSIQQLDAFRAGSNDQRPVDISFSEYVQEKYGITSDDYMKKVGVNSKIDTMQNLFTMPNQNIRWLVPEIIRTAVDLGLREAPFYPNLVASDQPINGLTAIMPIVNPSDAVPAKVNEAETIPLGDVSFGQKSVTLFKVGRGFKLTDEVKNYCSLDVVSLFIKDFGVQLGYALDSLAMDVIQNGNAKDGSESAPVLGVGTTGAIAYKDLLRIWVRASRLGRNFKSMVGGEGMALDILDLPEFKEKQAGTTQANLNLKTPVPNSADFYVHHGVSNDQVLMVDPSAALIKLTAQQLKLESERVVSNQTEAIYATLTTGFSKMYQDAAILLDKTQDFADAGFPDYMKVDPYLSYNLVD